MKIALIALATLVGLVALVTLIGLFMPRAHVATSEITLTQPIDSVYAVVRDIGGMTAWWSELKISERVTGTSLERWRQEAGGSKMQLDVIDESAPHRFTTRIVEEKGAPFGGAWVYALASTPRGTTISITERGWIGPPPFRVVAALTGLNKTMDAQLAALAKRFGEDVKPSHKP